MFLIKDIAKARGREALQLLNMRPIIKGSKERKKRERKNCIKYTTNNIEEKVTSMAEEKG